MSCTLPYFKNFSFAFFPIFIVEGNSVRIVNSGVYAMQMLQREMVGEAERTGLTTDEDIMMLVKELRNEDDNV